MASVVVVVLFMVEVTVDIMVEVVNNEAETSERRYNKEAISGEGKGVADGQWRCDPDSVISLL